MATWKMSTISATYPRVCSIAQSKNTGQYMLAIVAATTGADLYGRVFKSNNYGDTWVLLENLFPNNGIDTSHLNYATLATGPQHSSWVFYACAVSDDGKYQSFGQKANLYSCLWYSTNYGNTTGSTDEKWKYINFNSSVRRNATEFENFPYGVIQMMYSPGPYPVFVSDYIQFRSYNHLTGLTPATGSVTELGNFIGNYFTSTVPALYDNDFTTVSRRVVYYISGGNLYKNTNGTRTPINPLGWQVSIPGGGVAVSSNSNIVVAAKYANSTGGLWLSTDGGMNWTQKLVNINLNTVDMSHDGKYIITGPMGGGNLTFYLSQDFGETWTSNPNVLPVTGDLLKLHITNDGKRVVGAGLKSRDPEWEQPSTAGYVTYIGPLTAAEQRATGKTIAELLALSYSINDIRSAGYSANELIAAGITPNWDYYTTANRLNQTYVNNFIDLSGDMIIRNNGALTVGGDVSMGGNLVMTNPTTTKLIINDLSLNSRLFIGGNVSIQGNVSIGGDLSINKQFSGNFADGIIPTNAIIDYPSSSSGGDVTITGKVQTLGDVSFNGTTLHVGSSSTLKINGNLILSDQTVMSSYDNNVSSGTFAQENVIFKDSRFASVVVLGAATVTGTITSDYRIKENVEDLDSSFTLDSLTPVEYDNILSGNHEYGVIAHELQATYPFLVQGEKDGPEYQQVSYPGLIGVIVNEVKTLKQNLETLKTRI